ncbi:hypothetical protein L195_g063270, partial [Trifolium pratense]
SVTTGNTESFGVPPCEVAPDGASASLGFSGGGGRESEATT